MEKKEEKNAQDLNMDEMDKVSGGTIQIKEIISTQIPGLTSERNRDPDTPIERRRYD